MSGVEAKRQNFTFDMNDLLLMTSQFSGQKFIFVI